MRVKITRLQVLPANVVVSGVLRDYLGIGLAEAFHLAKRLHEAPANEDVLIELTDRDISTVTRFPDVGALLRVEVLPSA
jgi:hypothetical protein